MRLLLLITSLPVFMSCMLRFLNVYESYDETIRDTKNKLSDTRNDSGFNNHDL